MAKYTAPRGYLSPEDWHARFLPTPYQMALQMWLDAPTRGPTFFRGGRRFGVTEGIAHWAARKEGEVDIICVDTRAAYWQMGRTQVWVRHWRIPTWMETAKATVTDKTCIRVHTLDSREPVGATVIVDRRGDATPLEESPWVYADAHIILNDDDIAKVAALGFAHTIHGYDVDPLIGLPPRIPQLGLAAFGNNSAHTPTETVTQYATLVPFTDRLV